MRKFYTEKQSEIIGYCDDCGEPIYAWQKHLDTEEKTVCEDCLADYLPEDWIKLTHLKWTCDDIPKDDWRARDCE